MTDFLSLRELKAAYSPLKKQNTKRYNEIM